jgi:hypothetical protein
MGQTLDVKQWRDLAAPAEGISNELAVTDEQGRLVAIVQVRGTTIRPTKVFAAADGP